MVLSLSNDDANVIEKCLLDPEYYYQKYSESVDIFIEERFTRVCQRLIANRDIISSLLSARQQDKKIHTGEWTWTKGMKEVYDFTPFDAALREFREETGILEIPSYTADNNEIETRYIVNNREYINVFWICKFDQEFTANIDTDNMEVCDSGWFDAGQINELISPLCSESFHIALDRV